MSTAPTHGVDVVVLGGGYSGSLAALLLARKGYSVVLIERDSHPRYTIGEGTTAEQNRVHAWLGRKYGVRELVRMSSYGRMKGLPVPTWPKEGFFFAFDDTKPGMTARSELMFQTVPWPVGPDYHASRAEYDLFLLSLAQQAGVRVMGQAEVTEADLSGPVVLSVSTPGGPRTVTARFLVDASGFGRYLARTLDLIDDDPELIPLRTRAVYGLFLGVHPFEQSYGRSRPRRRLSRDHGTKHMVWDWGWAWVIPFENGLTSVGAVLNMNRDPLDHGALSPREALAACIAQHAPFAALMDGAEPVRPIVRTGRMQWAARQMLGQTWFMLPPASGFSDPLLSPGMAVAAAGVARLVEGIDAVLRQGRPAPEALGHLVTLNLREVRYIAAIQQMMVESFDNFELFAETLLLYRLAVLVGGLKLSGEPGHPWLQALWGFDNPALRDLVDAARQTLLAGRARGQAGPDLAREVRETIVRHDVFGYTQSRFNRPTVPGVYLIDFASQLSWTLALRRSADPQVRAGAKEGVGDWLQSLGGYGLERARSLTRVGRPSLQRSRSRAGIAARHIAILLGGRP